MKQTTRTTSIASSPFKWKWHNNFRHNNKAEIHYKCEKTGAWKCKEFKEGGGLKSITYSMPESEDYNIKTEEELIMNIFGGKKLKK